MAGRQVDRNVWVHIMNIYVCNMLCVYVIHTLITIYTRTWMPFLSPEAMTPQWQ